MKKFLLLCLIGIITVPAISQTIYTGAVEDSDPIFNRPDPGAPPVVLSTVGSNVYYDVISFTVVTPGLVSFTSESPNDNFGVLYGTGGFNSASPLTNALVANDDAPIGNSFGFVYEFTEPGTYYLVVTTFKNNSVGTYTVAISPVGTTPVKLTSFTAEKGNGSVNILKWSTTHEINIEKYQVMHSTDGKNFTDLPGAALNAKSAGGTSVYSFNHQSPSTGVNFYRLKISEKGGSSTISQVVSVDNRKNRAGIVKIYPNPTADFLYIETKAALSGKASITVINAAGETLSSKEYILSNQPVLPVDVRKLARGKYYVRTTIDNETTVSSFIKN